MAQRDAPIYDNRACRDTVCDFHDAEMEVVGGVLWVYLPIFGINETPSMLTMIGGITLLIAIMLDSVGTGKKAE